MDHRWVYGSYLVKDGQVYIFDETNKWEVPVDASTVGQFTGLLDKNGKEIYGGDIVKAMTVYNNVSDVAHDFFNCPVFWGHGSWLVSPGVGYDGIPLADAHFSGAPIEVIGNIHENPDLLDPDNQLYDPAKDPSLEKEEQKPFAF